MRNIFSRDRSTVRPAAGVSGLLALLVIIAALATGCAGPLKVEYGPGFQETAAGAEALVTPVKLAIESFADARGAEPPSEAGSRTIGEITSVVSNMNSGPLTLADDVTDIVTAAFGTELAKAGYVVVTDTAEAADYVVSGEVRRFRLDIKERDRIDVAISASLARAGTGDVVWSGDGAYKDDRYAGVLGNSRKTISTYLSKGVGSAIGNMLPALGKSIDADVSKQGAPVAPAAPKAAPPAAPAPSTPQAAPAPATTPLHIEQAGQGTLVIDTTPPSAKVYIDGIYYGLTPITIDMEPGVYDLMLKRTGYRDETERVSVRPAQTTRMDVRFVER